MQTRKAPIQTTIQKLNFAAQDRNASNYIFTKVTNCPAEYPLMPGRYH